ncbi:mucin-3B-like [Mytilus trossulus]|uniref:mucin-3B-like n=1 Tax=Mytilus trossulus TaxID=6551 RepID=UPI003003AC66
MGVVCTGLLLFVCMAGSSALNITMNQNILGLLGPSSVQLNCSFDTDAGDVLFLINFKAFIRGAFRNIASFSPPNFGAPALILTDGFYLIGRVTLTNPTSASTTAIMTFDEVACEDETDYQCEINYQDGATGDAPSPLPFASTNLTVRAAAEKPIDSPLITGVNGSIIEGQNVTFTCSGNVGNPPGTFIWEKYRMIGFFPKTYEDKPTTITPGLVNCTNNGTSSVTIAMESEDDRSLVRCVIKQEFGDVFQQTSILSVLYSAREPVIITSPDQPSYIEGSDPITLTCWGAGNPIPTYTWYREANTTILSTTSSYVINDVTVENGGTYICVIENMVDGRLFNDSSAFNIIIDSITTDADTTESISTEYSSFHDVTDTSESQTTPNMLMISDATTNFVSTDYTMSFEVSTTNEPVTLPITFESTIATEELTTEHQYTTMSESMTTNIFETSTEQYATTAEESTTQNYATTQEFTTQNELTSEKSTFQQVTTGVESTTKETLTTHNEVSTEEDQTTHYESTTSEKSTAQFEATTREEATTMEDATTQAKTTRDETTTPTYGIATTHGITTTRDETTTQNILDPLVSTSNEVTLKITAANTIYRSTSSLEAQTTEATTALVETTIETTTADKMTTETTDNKVITTETTAVTTTSHDTTMKEETTTSERTTKYDITTVVMTTKESTVEDTTTSHLVSTLPVTSAPTLPMTSMSTPSNNSSTDAIRMAPTSSNNNTGAIVGGIIGAMVAIAASVFVLKYLLARQKSGKFGSDNKIAPMETNEASGSMAPSSTQQVV